MNDALKTDTGFTRENNQDTLATAVNKEGDKLYILCDGMGGYKGGEVASFECSKLIKNAFKNSKFSDVEEIKLWLYEIIIKANERINDLANKDSELSKMGTTVLCLVVSKIANVYASVGDSRIYSYTHKDFTQLSEDQTFAVALLKAGYISKKEALIHPKKNILLSAIGSNSEDVDVQIAQTFANNYLLCSDGLYTMVADKEIHKILNSDNNIEQKAQLLIDSANSNGGKDNVSVILVEGLL